MQSRRIALCFLVTLLLAPCVLAGAMYAYDPLSIFHMPWGRPFTISRNMRQQNLALIKHFDFDSVIMGNSHTANTSANEISNLLGGKFMNLSMDGSNVYEQSFVLHYIIRQRDIKTVFRLISPSHVRKGHGDYPIDNWAFLYDENPWNDLKVYLNPQHLQCLSIWSTSEKCVGRQVDMDTPTAWHMDPGHASRFGGIDNWILHRNNHQLADLLRKTLPAMASALLSQRESPSPETVEAVRAIINDFMVRPAIDNPSTRFVCFFSPNSLLSYAINVKSNSMEYYLYFVKEVVRLCEPVANIEIYGFDNEDFTGDITNYKDAIHYTKDINSLIIQSIAAGRNRLTVENVDGYIDTLYKRAENYDICKLNDYVQSRLESGKRHFRLEPR